MKFFNFFVFFIIINLNVFSKLKYEDVNKNHWSYNSIEQLVNQGIIKEDSFYFEGNKKITKYEFAFMLANTINKINTEKANKDELKALKVLVTSFANELNEIGFNTEKFYTEIQKTEENIEDLKNELHKTNMNMKILEKRIHILEKELGI